MFEEIMPEIQAIDLLPFFTLATKITQMHPAEIFKKTYRASYTLDQLTGLQGKLVT